MNNKLALALILCIGGCGGSDGQDASSGSSPAPVNVMVTTLSNGCLVSHNAEAEVNYALGSHSAKTLLWNCANINSSQGVGVEAFYAVDAVNACFVQKGIVQKAANCAKRATAPNNPALSTTILGINSPNITRVSQTLYQLNLDIQVTNTGNVTAFGAFARVFAVCIHNCLVDGTQFFFKVNNLVPLTPGQAIVQTFSPPPTGPIEAGGTYDLTIDVFDFFQNHIGSTDFSVTAP